MAGELLAKRDARALHALLLGNSLDQVSFIEKLTEAERLRIRISMWAD
jgi:hypothetical protein